MSLPCLFLMGPTASGKTDLAVALTNYLPCEVISVDSAMVYRGMDIGTAKPDADLLARVPHRLIDILDPAEHYSAAQFCQDALREIDDIQSHGHIPLLVGGTMLYFRALQEGLSDLPTGDEQVRAMLNAEAAQFGWVTLHQRLAAVDPETAERIHPHDPQRIQRALEVYLLSGIPLSVWYKRGKTAEFPYPLIKIGLNLSNRQDLHERIATRFQIMLKQGLIAEVEKLYTRGDLNPDLPSMRAVGYRQVWQYLAGELAYADLPQRAIVATRQFAKRQLTWLRAENEVQWFDSEAPDLILQVLKYLRDNPKKLVEFEKSF